MALLLVTNDDGIHAAGLAALADALTELGEVWVIAPEREQSACGHALTLHRPLRTVSSGERRFAVNGTPSDCVNLGVLGFMPERPAIVVSGINHGGNLGDDVTYSGTVSAAMEATLLGVPAVAVSLVDGSDFTHAAAWHARSPCACSSKAAAQDSSQRQRATRARAVEDDAPRHRVYSDKVVEQADPRGRTHYWIGAGEPHGGTEGTDMAPSTTGSAVSPLHLDSRTTRRCRA